MIGRPVRGLSSLCLLSLSVLAEKEHLQHGRVLTGKTLKRGELNIKRKPDQGHPVKPPQNFEADLPKRTGVWWETEYKGDFPARKDGYFRQQKPWTWWDRMIMPLQNNQKQEGSGTTELSGGSSVDHVRATPHDYRKRSVKDVFYTQRIQHGFFGRRYKELGKDPVIEDEHRVKAIADNYEPLYPAYFDDEVKSYRRPDTWTGATQPGYFTNRDYRVSADKPWDPKDVGFWELSYLIVPGFARLHDDHIAIMPWGKPGGPVAFFVSIFLFAILAFIGVNFCYGHYKLVKMTPQIVKNSELFKQRSCMNKSFILYNIAALLTIGPMGFASGFSSAGPSVDYPKQTGGDAANGVKAVWGEHTGRINGEMFSTLGAFAPEFTENGDCRGGDPDQCHGFAFPAVSNHAAFAEHTGSVTSWMYTDSQHPWLGVGPGYGNALTELEPWRARSFEDGGNMIFYTDTTMMDNIVPQGQSNTWHVYTDNTFDHMSVLLDGGMYSCNRARACGSYGTVGEYEWGIGVMGVGDVREPHIMGKTKGLYGMKAGEAGCTEWDGCGMLGRNILNWRKSGNGYGCAQCWASSEELTRMFFTMTGSYFFYIFLIQKMNVIKSGPGKEFFKFPLTSTFMKLILFYYFYMFAAYGVLGMIQPISYEYKTRCMGVDGTCSYTTNAFFVGNHTYMKPFKQLLFGFGTDTYRAQWLLPAALTILFIGPMLSNPQISADQVRVIQKNVVCTLVSIMSTWMFATYGTFKVSAWKEQLYQCDMLVNTICMLLVYRDWKMYLFSTLPQTWKDKFSSVFLSSSLSQINSKLSSMLSSTTGGSRASSFLSSTNSSAMMSSSYSASGFGSSSIASKYASRASGVGNASAYGSEISLTSKGKKKKKRGGRKSTTGRKGRKSTTGRKGRKKKE